MARTLWESLSDQMMVCRECLVMRTSCDPTMKPTHTLPLSAAQSYLSDADGSYLSAAAADDSYCVVSYFVYYLVTWNHL